MNSFQLIKPFAVNPIIRITSFIISRLLFLLRIMINYHFVSFRKIQYYSKKNTIK